jgi:predicted ABC-type ATPase
MTSVLHILAGPNGAGKSTFVERFLGPRTGLPFVNADVIAAGNWPGDEERHAYEASTLAAEERERLIGMRASFLTETVFSHPSKTALIRRAIGLGYEVSLHVILVPLAQSECRVQSRVARGGHSVPADKIASRYERLWNHVADARLLADHTYVYDNSTARHPFRRVGVYSRGTSVRISDWPTWSPLEP